VDSLSLLVKNDLSLTPGSPDEVRSVTSITTKSPEAYRAYVEGDELRKRLQGIDAKTALERAIELDNKLAMAYYALQEVDNLIGDRAGAREAIVKAWDLRGNVTEMERLLIEAGYYADVEGNTMKTAQTLEVLVQKFPHYQAAYRPLVSAHLDRCEFEEAEKAISKGLRNDSLDRRLLNQSAYLSAGFDQKQRALNALDQFLRIAPVEANVYDSKGELHYWFGDADSAVYWFKRANTFRANFSSRALARIALLRQDYRGAADYFSSLAAGGPDDKAESECASAVISMHQGKIRMAHNQLLRNLQSHRAKQLTRAVALDCTYLTFLSYELHDHTAMVSYAQMRADERKKTLSDPVYGRDLLAWAWLMSGNATKPSALLDEINHDIKGTSRRWQLVLDYATALLSYEKRDYQNSLNQFERAFQLLFPNRPPDFVYGVVLVKTGNTSKGIHELQKVATWFPFLWNVLSIYPTALSWPIASVKAHYWLGVAYEAQGQNEQALNEFQQFLEIWKAADFDSPEIANAKVRFQKLKRMAGK
jgi:tetratricopeptide (TPR) repeat protein